MQRDMSFTCHAKAQTHAKSGFEQLKKLRSSTFTCTPTPFHLGGFGDFERFERFRVLGCSVFRVLGSLMGFKFSHSTCFESSVFTIHFFRTLVFQKSDS